MKFPLFLPLILAAQAASLAQAPAPEVEIPFPADIPIPPSPPIAAEEMQKTITVPEGFKVELVASEPMIKTPVVAQFDEDGRLWVVEMNGYMPNVEGKGEDVKNGRVVVLEDTDGDGRMDRNTVFLDQLVMPRAIMLRKGGALVCEPPAVYWCPDANHDLVADGKEVLIPKYVSSGDPEHQPNGLMLALDNWIYSAKSKTRYRFAPDGSLKTEETLFRGQWGITQDDFGRIYYDTNSDQLRGDLLPSAYLARNANFKTPEGVNVQVAKSQRVFPGRVNPGINRGYREGQLINGKLAEFTAAGGPLIYRGDLFPEDFYGDSFVPEPSANMVKQNQMWERDGDVMAVDAYKEREFMTSTSERFRPVNAYNGPDGALYIVDMARGLVQHITYITPWLRRQILDRGLDQPLDQGRIWRIVPVNAKRRSPAQLSKMKSVELAGMLTQRNGWTRDTAQRLIVERGGEEAVRTLEQLASAGTEAVGRLHALWTLEGLGRLKADVFLKSLNDSDPKVRATALRLSEPFLKDNRPLHDRALRMATDSSAEVRLQALCTLGNLKTAAADAAMIAALAADSESYLARSAAISGLQGRELEFLRAAIVNPAWRGESPGRRDLFSRLARCVTDERKAGRVQALLDLAIDSKSAPEWQRFATINGAVGIIPVPEPPAGSLAAEQAAIGSKAQGSAGLGRGFRPIKLDAEPPQLARLARAVPSEVAAQASKAAVLFTWPGKPGVKVEPKVPPLTPAQQKFVAAGKAIYGTLCFACHQPNGQGQEGLAPPVANSEWSVGPEGRLIRIVLQGVSGPITVNGKDYNLDMPGLGAALTDEQVAQVLSYIRRDFGNVAPVVETAAVTKVREATKDRNAAWNAAELQAIR